MVERAIGENYREKEREYQQKSGDLSRELSKIKIKFNDKIKTF